MLCVVMVQVVDCFIVYEISCNTIPLYSNLCRKQLIAFRKVYRLVYNDIMQNERK